MIVERRNIVGWREKTIESAACIDSPVAGEGAVFNDVYAIAGINSTALITPIAGDNRVFDNYARGAVDSAAFITCGVAINCAVGDCWVALPRAVDSAAKTTTNCQIASYSAVCDCWAAVTTEDSAAKSTTNCRIASYSAICNCWIAVFLAVDSAACIVGDDTIGNRGAAVILAVDSAASPLITISYCKTFNYSIMIFVIVEIEATMAVDFYSVAVDDAIFGAGF